jgi:hypothetical protein
MSSQDEFDEPSVIHADADEPGLLYAFIDEKPSARLAGSIADIHGAHGHERFRGKRRKASILAVSIKTPLKDALINGSKSLTTFPLMIDGSRFSRKQRRFCALRRSNMKRDRDYDMLTLRTCQRRRGDLHGCAATEHAVRTQEDARTAGHPGAPPRAAAVG